MNILLVDDHRLLAEALTGLIEARFPDAQVHQAGTLADALRLLDDRFELVLLDLSLPDATGMEAVHAVRTHAPQTRTVVISADDRPDTVRAAIELGASGFVPKKADSRQLLAALSATLEGGVPLPPALLAQAPSPAVDTTHELTPRQRDVLRLLIQGQSNKLICRHLGLSESSVKTHLEAVYRRLGVSSRTQAVMAAARLGLKFPAA
ncbi:response regulator [Roseateles sp. BYS87W]|uniref:Response regulator n=1 Tax=Pelomonas baiyunensis TaxID=3299026 RepID=A0ABW7GV21_9BURK